MSVKSALKAPPRRSGRVKRDRRAVLLRIDPSLAKWYAAAAEKQGRSRSQFMERWLAVLNHLMTHMERWQNQGLSPFDAVDIVGADFVGELIRLGLANDLMERAWELHLAGDRRELESLRGRDDGGRAKGKAGRGR